MIFIRSNSRDICKSTNRVTERHHDALIVSVEGVVLELGTAIITQLFSPPQLYGEF